MIAPALIGISAKAVILGTMLVMKIIPLDSGEIMKRCREKSLIIFSKINT
jgi:hypothetical protein